MSDKKLISPLLDGFTLGNPMSNRSGIRCYPAIKENSDKKYIVKRISIPSSQVQLDALLLTGAYKDPADAMDYFLEQANGIMQEAEVLQKLSRLEGFLPYEGWQLEPMENGALGYQLYLVGTYKRTLEKFMRRNLMTHLQAVNLGLDMCAAMAICRRAGLMYVDLKPSNIFMAGDKEYRIGDLGFVKLDSLKFTSLPEKFVSPYSAPEIHDAINPLNETVDCYALGMLLYQIYNDGNLPFKGKAPAEALPSPCNADYEIAEIIMKAIAPKMEDRWKDPLEMGKALAAYLQRNTVNNTPISTPAAIVTEPEIVPVRKAEPPVEVPAEPEAPETESPAPVEEPPEQKPAMEEPVQEEIIEPAEPEQQSAPEEEKIPVAVGAPAEPEPESEPAKTEEEEEEDRLFDFDLEGIDLRDYDEIAEEEAQEDETEEETVSEPEAPKKRKWVGTVIFLLILGLLGFGCFYGYQNYYLQTIDQMTVSGDMNELVVQLDTDVQDQLLSVSCTDTYGNTQSQSVVDGKAVFQDLKPGTQYKLEVNIEGFHSLTGYTSQFYTTSNITNVVSFTAVTGAEDGSVLLTFTVDGADTDKWQVTYGTEGEDDRTISVSGHSITIRELTVGKTYTFTLQTTEALELIGQTELQFTASRLVIAGDLQLLSCVDGNLELQWTAPEDVVIPSWTVRCISEDGEQHMVTTTEAKAILPDIDTTKACTVEVIAEGMTQGTRVNVTANPLTVKDFTVHEEDQEALTLTWDYEGAEPAGGWLLMYSIDGSDYQRVVKCDSPSAVIEPRIHGATYSFEIRAANGITIFDNIHIYNSPNARIFDLYNLPAEHISANLLVTPEIIEWTYRNVGVNDFTDTFSLGQGISILLEADKEFSFPRDEVNILYVIRDGNSNVVSELIAKQTMTWWDMWVDEDHHFCELNLPKLPDEPGNYSLALYFNGYAIMTITFTIQ